MEKGCREAADIRAYPPSHLQRGLETGEAGFPPGVLCSYFQNTIAPEPLAQGLGLRWLPIKASVFPDGQLFFSEDVLSFSGQTVWVLDSLIHAQTEAFELLFLGRWLRAQGAKRIIWLAPYLAGMREAEGEAWQARWLLQLVAQSFDALWTICPHVARQLRLAVPKGLDLRILCPALALAQWIQTQNWTVDWILGPDQGAQPLCAAVAQHLGLPYACLKKHRSPNGEVKLGDPHNLLLPSGARILMLDDLICTGATAAAALRYLRHHGQIPVGLVAVHRVENPLLQRFHSYFPEFPVWTTSTLRGAQASIDLTPWLLKTLLAAQRT